MGEMDEKKYDTTGGDGMKVDEFKSFEDELPVENKWTIVTNNINAVDAHGEMSHVWLTSFVTRSEKSGYVTFDADSKIMNLTHWKYA